jgi:hypothetical protein
MPNSGRCRHACLRAQLHTLTLVLIHGFRTGRRTCGGSGSAGTGDIYEINGDVVSIGHIARGNQRLISRRQRHRASVQLRDIRPNLPVTTGILQEHFTGDYITHVCEVRVADGELSATEG